MGPRNLTILFISTVAVSLVLLILLFSLLAKNVDLSFDTKMPESAPDLGNFYKDGQPSKTRGENVGGASVKVPQTSVPATAPARPLSGVGDEDLSKLQDETPVKGDTSSEGTDDIPTPPTADNVIKKETDRLESERPVSEKPVKPVDVAKPVAPKPAPKPVAAKRIELEPTTAPTPAPAENPAPAGPSNQ